MNFSSTWTKLAVAGGGLLWIATDHRPADDRDREVSFDRDVRPILSEYCFKCHGPDAKSRKAKLRLDTREGLFAPRDNGAAIVAGKPDRSAVIRRVTAHDPADRMPPASTKRSLSPVQIKVLRDWIEQGARWQSHWAFEKPVRLNPPDSAGSTWPRTPIDRFVLARLRREGLTPAKAADRRRLLRRVTFDLTGLPPTPDELRVFAADRSENAFEKVVERLLDSPRYGERMAWDWLDAARYADTNGYQGDRTRTMWPYRDWVVEALNRNLRYDEFLTWQLAGDLLPEPTFEQRLASAFCRNHMINGEGGRIPEENRVEYIFDSVETIGTVWMGLTLTCCRCHDHKFDPLTQRNYYQLFDYFNQTPVTGAGDNPQTAPVLTVRSAADRARVEQLQKEVARLDQQNTTLLPVRARSSAGQKMTIEADRAVLVGGANADQDTYTVEYELPKGRVTGLRLDALRHPSMTKGGLARSNSGNFVLTEIEVSWKAPGQESATPIEIASATATFEQSGFSIRNTFDGKSETGWAVYKGGVVDRDHSAVFAFANPVEPSSTATLVVILRHDSVHKNHNLGRFRLSTANDANARSELDRLRKRTNRVKVMVMQDRVGKRRETRVLDKGLYNQPREVVHAGVPEVLPPLPKGAPANRLSLARWLVDPDHPLTARVVVNRHWQKFFGTGLVKTVEDFGAQGDKPSHPELLAWLATEFIRTGFDVKALHRLIVTSATYRQSARVTQSQIQRDPQNRLLARGPRHRLRSWMIRDMALTVSGLLVEKVGGPPVKPYQPTGVWAEATFGKTRYQADTGDNLYRRSLYTFWRRIIKPTMFFDEAKRQTCSVGITLTNTPLHALATLNDTTYVEAARALAQRMLVESGPDSKTRMTTAFELATSRRPDAAELEILLGRLAILRREYADKRSEALKLLAVGASEHDTSLDPIEHAAWTGVCALILNLDETLNN